MLEKSGKDKTFIKNWRPISLINFDTKLFSKTYAERFKSVMPSLVHPNQVAYVKTDLLVKVFGQKRKLCILQKLKTLKLMP